MQFEWDEKKNAVNIEKHGISFEEAKTVFLDVDGLLIPDPDHSDDEDRFILMGFSSIANLLVVVHCYREMDSSIRIISARKATRSEEKQYNSQKGRW